MNDRTINSAHGMHMVNDCLIVPVTGNFDDAYTLQLQRDLLKNVKIFCTKKVLIDVSSIRILDAFTFSIFKDTAQMILMLGAEVVFVGFQAGVASALVDLDIEFGDIRTAVTIQDGFELFQSKTSVFMVTDEIEEITATSSNADLDENERIDT
ncbi:MAG: STAS domain-containing protein [Deltaproteobacteria bacterium]|nr:STAS domain-containing protein [Deltaproteobacteria bacterium]